MTPSPVVLPLLRASHAQPTLMVTAIATALALSAGQGAASLLVLGAVLTGQLSVGWSNDYLDRRRDSAAGRIDKPIVAGEVPPRLVAGSACVALGLCVPLSLASGVVAGTVHLGAVGAGLAYNVGLKSTVASPLPYAVAFAALPSYVTLGLPGSPSPRAWVLAAGALMGVGAHFVNTIPDRVHDAATGVRGLPQRLPRTASVLIGVGAIGAASLITALGPTVGPGPAVIVFTAAAMAVTAWVLASVLVGRVELAWSLTLGVAALTVAGLVANGDALTS